MEASESIEFLMQQSQLLWRETSFDRLLQKFVDIERDNFALSNATLLQIRMGADGKAPTIARSHVAFKQCPTLDEALSNAVATQLMVLNLKTPEMRQGIYYLDCIDSPVAMALLGDPAADWYALVWESEKPTGDVALRNGTNDFLVRQLQSACIWFHRLDKTQAMLYRDDLTGVFNSRYLSVAIDSEIRRSQRFQTNFCLLFIDLDNFKTVNDKFGHLAGSSILRQLADILRETSREVDSVIRYGGDEFVVVLLGANADTGRLAAERMRRKIEDARFMLDDGNHVSLTVSIGVTAFPDHTQDRDELLKLADSMMYVSKRGGKNRVTLASRSADLAPDNHSHESERK